ncbi:unnamed protein product [Closterium sp. NIES-53]
MAPGQQASAEGMAVEGAEDKEEADLAATTSMEAVGVVDTAATTRATDAVAADSTASATIVLRADICGAIAKSSLMDGLLLKAKRVEEQEEGEEEAVEAMAIAEVVLQEPSAVGKVTLHSLDYWVIDSGTTYSMTPRVDLLTELEPSPVKHVTSALGQRAEVKGMGKAMFKGADGKMVGLKNVLWVPNLAANLISVRRLQKAGMDTSSKGAKTYTVRLGERLLWDLHEDRDVYNEMWQIPVVPMPRERQVAASISTKGEAVGSDDGANGHAKEMKSKKCNLGGTSKLGEHEESGAAAQTQHKVVARVVQCPNEEQVAAGMRVAKYLGQTPTVGLQYSAAAQRRQKGVDGVESGRLFLTAFSDASFASEPEDMTSVGGFICCVGGGSIAWESKKQVDQALSSVESEYMALFRAVREIVWQRRLLAELGKEHQGPTPLYCDS